MRVEPRQSSGKADTANTQTKQCMKLVFNGVSYMIKPGTLICGRTSLEKWSSAAGK